MNVNKECAAYCITVIRCLMQEKAVPTMPEGVSLEELYAFAKLHGVEAMVFHGLEQLNIPETDPVWQNWRNRADVLLTQSIVQLAERDVLFAALPAAGIEILPVKGCWLKEQYPDIDYRQMSDLDMLIHPEDRKKAEAVMAQLGYTKEEDAAENHDAYIKPPYMGVELHHSLLPEDDSRLSYYDDVWEKAVSEEGFPGVFRLKPEDEYIFYYLHLFKHVLHAGTGIRSFLDSLVYRKLWADMNKEYLRQEFEKLGITEFVRCVETITDCWFETGASVSTEMEAMAGSILSAGTYGTESGRFRNEMKEVGKKFRNPFVVKIVYLLSCLFLPLKAMQILYPILNKIPFLLPVFWIWRPISRLLFRPEALTSLVKQTNEEGDKLWSEYNWQEFQSK